jgi:hypothetical protein
METDAQDVFRSVDVKRAEAGSKASPNEKRLEPWSER